MLSKLRGSNASKEKLLIQKYRGGFQNGPWTGHFTHHGAKRYFMLHLHFHRNGKVDGDGRDEEGKLKVKDGSFTMHCSPNTFFARLRWESNTYEITLSGTLNAETGAVSGRFQCNGGDGDFFIQPSIAAIGHAVGGVQPGMDTSASERARKMSSAGGDSTASTTPTTGQSIRTLMEMGYAEELCTQAVKYADTIPAQIDWILAHAEQSSCTDTDTNHSVPHSPERSPRSNCDNSFTTSTPNHNTHTTAAAATVLAGTIPDWAADPAQVIELEAMGFSSLAAQAALVLAHGEVPLATEWLLTTPPAKQEVTITQIVNSFKPQRRRRAAGEQRSETRERNGDGVVSSRSVEFNMQRQQPSSQQPVAHEIPSDELIQQVLDILGSTDRHLAIVALLRHDNDIERALNWVLANKDTAQTLAAEYAAMMMPTMMPRASPPPVRKTANHANHAHAPPMPRLDEGVQDKAARDKHRQHLLIAQQQAMAQKEKEDEDLFDPPSPQQQLATAKVNAQKDDLDELFGTTQQSQTPSAKVADLDDLFATVATSDAQLHPPRRAPPPPPVQQALGDARQPIGLASSTLHDIDFALFPSSSTLCVSDSHANIEAEQRATGPSALAMNEMIDPI